MDPSEKQAAKYRSKNLMGYIQDKVDVGMTKLRSDEGVALDVAIVKATLQDEVVPKEKHVRTLKVAASATAPRQQVNYVIHGLAKRLEDKSGWLVTLKTLIVFHRLLREVDPSFQEELIKYQDRTGAHRMLRLEAFADHTTKDTWDYSAWIRVYSVYLDERVGVFKAMRFDPELEPAHMAGAAGHTTGAAESRESKLKNCSAAELLNHLPLVQKLLNRLIACIPEGAAQENEIVHLACSMVLRELRSSYRCVCEGIINLADKFFEMERADAIKGLDIYKDNVALNEKLNTFFSAINNIPSLKGIIQMPNLQSLPADFLTTMEEYVRDAPKIVDASGRNPVNAGAASLRNSSTMMRAAGATSPSITGTGMPPVIPAPQQGVLKIGPPTKDAPPAAAPTPAPEVDLLGDDFSAAPPQPAPPAAPDAAAAAHLSSEQQAGFPGNAFGGAPAFPPGGQPHTGSFASPPAARPGGFNPFAPAGMQGSPAGQPGPNSPPLPPLQAGFNSPPQTQIPPANPFAPAGYGAPAPYGYPPQHTGMQPQVYGGPTGYGASPATMTGGNPFGGAAQPVWGSGPPPGASSWGTNVVAGAANLKKSQDPLNDIGVDLFGKSNQPPVQQSLRDMKLQG